MEKYKGAKIQRCLFPCLITVNRWKKFPLAMRHLGRANKDGVSSVVSCSILETQNFTDVVTKYVGYTVLSVDKLTDTIIT